MQRVGIIKIKTDCSLFIKHEVKSTEGKLMIETDRLIIRKFRVDDWKDLMEYLSDEEVIRYSPYIIHTEEMAKKEVKERMNKEDILAVCLTDTKKVIGELIYENGEFDAKEIGFFFNTNYQGKGYAFEAASSLMNHAFTVLGVRRITARCDALNLKSQHLLERLGMRREGTLKKHIYFKHDALGKPIWADTCLYGILTEEWSFRF